MVSNDEVIAIDQDPDCVMGSHVRAMNASETWVRPLSDGSFGVVLLNKGDRPENITVFVANVADTQWGECVLARRTQPMSSTVPNEDTRGVNRLDRPTGAQVVPLLPASRSGQVLVRSNSLAVCGCDWIQFLPGDVSCGRQVCRTRRWRKA